jgi:hypothetical protein
MCTRELLLVIPATAEGTISSLLHKLEFSWAAFLVFKELSRFKAMKKINLLSGLSGMVKSPLLDN